MNRLTKLALALGLIAVTTWTTSGCVSVGGKEPLINIRTLDSGRPPEAANIPPGPEHAVCRAEVSRALAALQDCRRDKDNAKRKCDDKTARLERDKEDAEKDRDRWRSNYEQLRDSLRR